MKTVTKEYQPETKPDHKAYREKVKHQIDEIFDALDEMKTKKNEVKEGYTQEYEKRIKELEQKKADLKARYQKLEQASEDKWNEVNRAFRESSEDFRKGFNKLQEVFS